jgi:hypothetical protein
MAVLLFAEVENVSLLDPRIRARVVSTIFEPLRG